MLIVDYSRAKSLSHTIPAQPVFSVLSAAVVRRFLEILAAGAEFVVSHVITPTSLSLYIEIDSVQL